MEHIRFLVEELKGKYRTRVTITARAALRILIPVVRITLTARCKKLTRDLPGMRRGIAALTLAQRNSSSEVSSEKCAFIISCAPLSHPDYFLRITSCNASFTYRFIASSQESLVCR